MADEIKVKMSEFAQATQVNNADDIIILQNGENKKVKSPILESKIINRTVEELSKDGGVSLNIVNPKAVVPTYASLALLTNLQINDAYQVATNGLVYTWSGTAFQPDGQGFKVQPNVNGVVAEGNINAVSGGEVYSSVDRMYRTAYLNNDSSFIIINELNKTILFKSGINVVRGDGRFITTSDFTFTYENSPYAIFFNKTSLSFEIVLQTNVLSRYKDVNMSLIGVFRSASNKIYLNGIVNYTLNGVGFPYVPSEPIATNVIYNRNFYLYRASRTQAEKEWLNKAIVDIEFYNIKDSQTITLYSLGKGYGTSTKVNYLGFILAESGVPSKFLYADEFNNLNSIPYIDSDVIGVKTYYLRDGNNRFQYNNIIGKIVVDWDSIPLGDRVLESNSNVLNSNSLILREKYKTSYKYNVNKGIVKFALSSSLNNYFNSPEIESYSSADGVSSMIPKSPFQKVEDWFLKWDELIANKPLGYEITKEILTEQVPTDTTESGFLPIYAYSFKPSLLRAGDSTGNNEQVLPKIFINCSIHGFEKIPSFITYEFLKLVLNNWKGNSFLEYLRFNVEFIVIPSANPHGWNALNGAGTRLNFNGVDLNRNFPVSWVQTGTIGDDTFSGLTSMSEIETQSIFNFMQNNIGVNTILGLDFHNFHGTVQSDPKKYNMVWIISQGTELGQSSANLLIKELSIKYKDKSNLIPQSDDYYIGTSNNYKGSGRTANSMSFLGAQYACTFEVCQNFRFNPNFKGFDKEAMTFGVESLTNMVRVYLSNFIDEYNQLRS